MAKKSDEYPVSAVAEDPSLSRQAKFSTYKENTDLPDDNPPPGRQVIQELGKPKQD